jgi:TRAP-type mannitol/chloroaromatic compound transport system permease small subunit
VRVDIFYAKYSERTKTLVDLLSALLAVALSVIVIWLSLHYVQQAYVIDEGSPDPGGIPHRFIIKALIPVGFALLLVQSLANAIGCVDQLRRSR